LAAYTSGFATIKGVSPEAQTILRVSDIGDDQGISQAVGCILGANKIIYDQFNFIEGEAE
jgi:hypothetical protein